MPVVKVVELIGTSDKSFDYAIQEAVNRASKTIRGITGLDVIGQKVVIEDNKIKEYRVVLKVAFSLE
jgi:hypothetical protein